MKDNKLLSKLDKVEDYLDGVPPAIYPNISICVIFVLLIIGVLT